METYRYERNWSPTTYIVPIDDLLFKQRSGKLLTREEKDRVTKYANEQRKKKQSTKK